jgi:uncharacterized membrane protein YfcA
VELLFIIFTAFGASLLTFYSGFGLGTLLTPVFVLFFPVETAIALTAIVHLLNNLFKAVLTRGKADYSAVLKFGIPSFAGAFAGTSLLLYLVDLHPVTSFTLSGQHIHVTMLEVTAGLMLIVFAFLETSLSRISVNGKPARLYAGGLLSGFFGGLSGHQGALRSLFLSRMVPDKEVFVASGILISLFVDVTRIAGYTQGFLMDAAHVHSSVLAAAVAAAFCGAWVGNRYLGKVAMETVQVVVKWGIIAIGLYTVARAFS